MGLDMYLNGHRYLSNYDENDEKILDKINPITKEILNGFPITEIVIEAMYWRKVNAIHNWFVKNIQNGVDDCGFYNVDLEEIQILLDTVNKVLENKSLAEELLPTQSGFFFGSSDIDDRYFEELEYTKKGLEKILSEIPKGDWNWRFQYHSSW